MIAMSTKSDKASHEKRIKVADLFSLFFFFYTQHTFPLFRIPVATYLFGARINCY